MVSLLCAPRTAHAIQLFVANTNDSGPGSLRDAIDAANSGNFVDEIFFNTGVIGTITLNSQLPTVTRDCKIIGPNADRLTISGDNRFRIFNVASGGNLLLSRVALRAGNASNVAAPGLLTGGAINIESGGLATIGRVYFADNTALGGGAIENFGTLRISQSSFVNNIATQGSGGAIHSVPGSTLSVDNSTFVRNVASGSGGALRIDSGGGNSFSPDLRATLESLTISRNIADSGNNGGGAGDGLSTAANSNVSLRNSIVVVNRMQNVDGPLATNEFNITSGSQQAAGLEIDANNQLVLRDTYKGVPFVNLVAGGAAIDAGSARSTDVRDLSRPIDVPGVANVADGSDIGAVEYDPPRPSPTGGGANFIVNTSQDRDDGTCGVTDCSLREAINAANASPTGVVIGFSPGVGPLVPDQVLPTLTGTMEFRGSVAGLQTIARGTNPRPMRIFSIAPGANVTLFQISVFNGRASDGADSNGGGIFNRGTLSLNRSEVRLGFAGAALSGGGPITGAGGGIFSTGDLTIKDSTIIASEATRGGGVFATGPTLIVNSTLTNNRAEVGGGYNGSRSTITNSTITQNEATNATLGGGGGVYSIAAANAPMLIANTIISGNTAPRNQDVGTLNAGGITSNGYNLVGAGALGAFGATDVIAPDPKLNAPSDRNGGLTTTAVPQSDSPAVNAGDPSFNGTGAFDQRGEGFPRVRGGRLDIGAVETDSAAATNAAPSVTDFTLRVPRQTNFTFAVNSFDAAFSDPEGALPQAIRIVSLPQTGQLEFAGGGVVAGQTIARADLNRLVFRPLSGNFTTTTFQYNASDGALFAAQNATVTLDGVGPPPTVSNFSVSTDANPFTFSAALFDAAFSAPSGAPLSSVQSQSLPQSGGTLQFNGAPVTALQIIVRGDLNRLTFVPAAGFNGSTSFDYNASDGTQPARNPATITVRAANTPPTISAIANQTINSSSTTGPLAFSVGDAESAPAALTVSATSSDTALVPASGLVLEGQGANRTLTVTPAAGQTGSATITVTVSDGTGSTPVSFVLTVQAPNVAPVFGGGNFSGATGVSFSQQLSATDANGDALSFARTQGDLPPGLTLSASGLLSGTPLMAGNFAFTVAVTDGRGGNASALVTVAIAQTNRALVFADTIFGGAPGRAFSEQLRATASDGSALTYALTGGALPPGLSLSSRGLISGTPTATGSFSATITASDGTRQTTATVRFVIAEIRRNNSAPVADNQTLSAALRRPFSITLAARDADGDALTFTLASNTPLPAGTTLSREGVLSGAPERAGSFPFSVSVTDGRGGFARANYVLVVTAADDGQGPVITHSDFPVTSTRDALAGQTLEGTVRDVAATGITPSGVRVVYFQLRRASDGAAFNGTSFVADTNRGYFAVTLSAANAAGTRNFARALSFLPPASVMTPGRYSISIAAQDNAGNYSISVLYVTIAAPAGTAPSGARARTSPSAGRS